MSGSAPDPTASAVAAPSVPPASAPYGGSAPARPAPPPGRAGRGRRRKPWNIRVAPYLFVLPNMLVFGLFTIWPAINGFNVSLYDSGNGRTFDYVGGRNYERIVSDPEFWAAVRHTFVFVVGFVVISTVASIALAALLDAQRRGRAFFRAAFFLPVLLSPVVVGLIWEWVLDRKIGLLNTALEALGGGQPGWLVNPTLALGATVWVGVWTHIGFYTLITLAGLQGIDPALQEAAKIDGAGTWQRFRLITLPLLRPTAMVVIILSTITGFQAFDFIYTLTGGGPIGATTLIVQYVYENAFESPIRYGLASAGAVLLFITVLGVTLLNYLIGRRREAV